MRGLVCLSPDMNTRSRARNLLNFYVLAGLPFKDSGDVLHEPAGSPAAAARGGESAV